LSPFFERRVPQLLDEVIDLYRAAGRPLASLADEALDNHFVERVESYIGNPKSPARFRAVNDTAGEYLLRQRDAPIVRVLRLKEPLTAAKDWPPNLRPMLAKYQPHRPKLAVIISTESARGGKLPWVILAFGGFCVIPALAAIAMPEGANGKPLRPDTREGEAEQQRQFDWLLGLQTTQEAARSPSRLRER